MENCVICCEQDWDDCFEIQEFVSKDTYVFQVSYFIFAGKEREETAEGKAAFISFHGGWAPKKGNSLLATLKLHLLLSSNWNILFAFFLKGEEPEDTMMWFKTLQFYTQCLGGWRKRRKGLANIMIDPNLINSTAAMTLESTEEASGGQAASSSSSQS